MKTDIETKQAKDMLRVVGLFIVCWLLGAAMAFGTAWVTTFGLDAGQF